MAVPAQAQTAPDGAAPAEGGTNTPPPAPTTTFGFEEVAALAAERATRVYEQPVAEQVGADRHNRRRSQSAASRAAVRAAVSQAASARRAAIAARRRGLGRRSAQFDQRASRGQRFSIAA